MLEFTKALLVSMLLMLSSLPLYAFEQVVFTENDVTYRVTSEMVPMVEVAYVSDSLGNDDRENYKPLESDDIVIPESVSYAGKTYRVVGIATWAFAESELKSISLPPSIEYFSYQAFSGCNRLESIRIPASVNELSSGTFDHCTALKTVVFDSPCPLKALPKETFQSCRALVSVKLPESLQSLGEHSFYGCTSLVSLDIPESVETIGTQVFQECASLEFMDLPNSVRTLGSRLFAGCTSLKMVNLGNSVNVSSPIAGLFFKNSSLEAVNVSEDNPYYSSVEGVVYDKDFSELLLYPEGAGIEVNWLPTVTAIGAYAFRGWRGGYMEIPEGVTEIGDGAFAVCPSLGCVSFPATLRKIGKYAFNGDFHLTQIYCKMTDWTGGSIESFEFNPSEYPRQGQYLYNYNHTTVYVPAGLIRLYLRQQPWSVFGIQNIEEVDYSGVGEVVVGEVIIKVAGGRIEVTGTDAPVEIYDLSGRQLSRGSGEDIPELPAGVYIVRAGGTTAKVML